MIYMAYPSGKIIIDDKDVALALGKMLKRGLVETKAYQCGSEIVEAEELRERLDNEYKARGELAKFARYCIDTIEFEKEAENFNVKIHKTIQ